MKAQRIIHLTHFRFILLVPKEMKRHFRMFPMPRLYVFAETGIHHISVQIITLYALAGKHFTAKQRRYDTNTGTFIVFHFTKGERKLLGCSYAGEPGEETQKPQTAPALGGKSEIAMQKEVLVTDTDLRHGRTKRQISKSGQQFIKVNDQFRAGFLDAPMNVAHTLQIGRYFDKVVRHTARQAHPLIGRCRQKIRTEKALYRSLNTAIEEPGQMTGIAFTHQHFHDFMSVAAQKPFHGNGLGEMSPPLSLNNKKNFHLCTVCMLFTLHVFGKSHAGSRLYGVIVSIRFHVHISFLFDDTKMSESCFRCMWERLQFYLTG